MDVTLRKLRYFVAAAEHGNVTNAAATLNVSQPSVSTAVAQLEADFGAQLFLRLHSKGMALTPAGRTLLQQARDVLARVDDLIATMVASSREPQGSIHVGCLGYLAGRFFGDIARQFALRHPEIQVRLRDEDQEGLLASLRNGEIELAITYDLLSEERLEITELMEVAPYVIVHACHPLARRGRVHLRELAADPCILPDLPISQRYYAALFSAVGLTPDLRYRTQSIEAVRSFVANGLGYSILTSPIRSLETYDGKRLKTLELLDKVIKPKIVCVRDAGLQLRPATRAFADFLVAYFAGVAGEPPARR